MNKSERFSQPEKEPLNRYEILGELGFESFEEAEQSIPAYRDDTETREYVRLLRQLLKEEKEEAPESHHRRRKDD